MISTYFKIAVRYLFRNFFFTFTNLVGLSTGIASFLLIALFVQDQLSYDKTVDDREHLFRLVGRQEPSGLDPQHVAFTSAVWGPWLLEYVPQVDDVYRVLFAFSNIIEIDDRSFSEEMIFFSERNVLQRKGYEIIRGAEPGNMLSEPNTAVLSRRVAFKFFDNLEVLGETIKVGNHIYRITGIFSNDDVKSHLKADIFLSLSTVEFSTPFLLEPGNNTVSTYILLDNPASKESVEQIINARQIEFMEGFGPEMIMKNTFYLQPYGYIFLRSGHMKFQMANYIGDISYVYIFGIVGLFILGIACINFINLATAYSSKRSREVGLRKVLGASRYSLAGQFIGESMIITFLAIVGSLGIVELALPYYNAVLDTDLKISFTTNLLFNAGLLTIFVVVGFVSGFYPAVYLSRFNAASVLRSGSGSGTPRSSLLRRVLVVTQFAISTAMIMATIIVIHQIRHLKSKDLGFNPENMITLVNRQTNDYERLKAFRDALSAIPEIDAAGIGSGYSGVAGRQSMISTLDSVPVQLMVRYGYVDPDFFPVMQISVIEGRNFSFDYSTDPNRTMVINKAARDALGWSDPIGKRIANNDDEDIDYYTVIGVIDNYHYNSLHRPVEPAVYIWRPGDMSVINIRYNSDDPALLMEKIIQEYEMFFPGYYFNAEYLTGILNRQYQNDVNTVKIFLWFAILCILISCLGLFGLTSFLVNQKRKEISIRKVLGGNVYQISTMLLFGFIRWIMLAALLAIPFTWLVMERWLQGYAYHIQPRLDHIGSTILIILTLASITVLIITIRAAYKNPTETIKYE